MAKTIIIGMPYLSGIDSDYCERWMPIGAETRRVFRSAANPLHSTATNMQDSRAFWVIYNSDMSTCQMLAISVLTKTPSWP